MSYIGITEHVDLQHLYIDGSKYEANANKYTWVWKKSAERSRYKLFGKITALPEGINKSLMYVGLHIETNAEYTQEYPDEITKKYKDTSNQRILTVKVSVKSLRKYGSETRNFYTFKK